MSDIRDKKPKVLAARVARLRLTREERLVMARVDGELSVEQLVGVTGLAPDRLEQIVSKLAFDGALDLGTEAPVPAAPQIPELADGGTTSFADFAAALGMDPSSFVENPEAPAPEPERPERPAPQLEEVPALEELTQLEEVHDDEEQPDDASASSLKEDEEVARAVAERNYRQLYEARWHPLPADQRAVAAKAASGADLLALCFDPDPHVIGAVLENTTTGLDHVRLIALYHRTNTGLEIVARRQDWIRDLLVERRLLRNPMIGEIVLARVMGPKRLFPTYKIAIDRDIPELSRIKCREMIRQKWATAPSEERANLLLRTEARCLGLMTGCTFDAKTTAILCGRPINSAMFVQSIAKFAASPLSLLAHLFKQPFVRKNPGLKKMLLAHPNMRGDVKRS